MLVKQFSYLSKEETETLISSIHNPKHEVLILLMLDAGLRVTEACSLQFRNLDFKNRLITIQSAKKRGKKSLRSIPMSGRLYRAFGDYLNAAKLALKPTQYVFPSADKHITRQAVWKILKKFRESKNIPHLHPHALRHTFATHHLSEGTSLAEIKEMLGHSNYNTTLIYANVPTEQLREKVHAVTAPPKPFWVKLYQKIKPPKPAKIINIDFTENYFTIGRNEELKQLNAHIQREINTLLVGDIGTGKSHLLNNIQTHKKILRLDDTESIKKSLANILLLLYQSKENVMHVLWKDFTPNEVKTRIQRQTTTHLCDTIIASVQPKEYVLLIDDITRITPSGKKAIEKLKDTFIIVAAARQVKANDTSFIWNFEKMTIKNLSRKFALQLINQLSAGLEVENWQLFRNHVYNQTNGNPRAIAELMERYRKEPFLDTATIREVKHIGALKEFDFTFIIMLFLGVLMATRYMSRELDEPALRFIGSLAMIALLFMRPMMRSLSRKFV